jgi:hypothetical protein
MRNILDEKFKLQTEFNAIHLMSSLRIISYNVNGIRAAMKKGLVEWLQSDPADVI